MFRIESYITPIIFSHIDKYVKDFRPKDAQVSLWGGEVAFQNLDLRLDVLEEELQLPFSFVSGHIHELTVLVPWTKIASEPIQITINTIEFVLKLKSCEEQRQSSSNGHRKKSTTDVVQNNPAPGYMASLINKIANNVSVKLHNIILKYVEEDIVVSMNIQLLSFDSADDNWEPSFIDISPTKVLLKKVVNITDLTICLDKRNPLGIIDVCQEPILYRCSMQIRMLRRYNISSLHATSLLRMDIFTDSIELNVSAQQYPMAMRLLVLANTLREGSMRQAPLGSEAPSADEGDETSQHGDESMMSWAWNMLPTIFPGDTTDEEPITETVGHVLHLGLYIKTMQVTFKSQEMIPDVIANGPMKLKYHPMLKVTLFGLYSNTISVGRRWFNTSGGCSFFGIYPIGVCVCGNTHDHKVIITSADVLCDHEAFLEDSLRDPNCPENSGQNRSYDRLWDSHDSKVQMDELLCRTPALAFDMAHAVEIPEDSSANISSNLEYSNLNESHMVRAAIGGFHLRYHSSLVHIIETLHKFADNYDYPPYVPTAPVPTRANIAPPSDENLEALMSELPIRNFHISIQHPLLEFHPGEHEARTSLPFFVIELEDVNIRMTDAYYPNRVIQTTCMLPEPPTALLDACYTKYSADFARMSVFLNYKNEQQNCHLKVTTAEVTMRQLLSPDLFDPTSVPRSVLGVNVENVSIYMSNPQMVLLHCLVDSIVQHAPIKPSVFDTTLIEDSTNASMPIVDISINRIICTLTQLHPFVGIVGTVLNVIGVVYTPSSLLQVGYIESHKQKAIFLVDNQLFQEFIAISLQLPIDLSCSLPKLNPPILAITVNELQINIDPLLHSFLNYKIRLHTRKSIFARYEPYIMYESNSESETVNRTPLRSILTDIPSITISRKPVTEDAASIHSGVESISDRSLVQLFPRVPGRSLIVLKPPTKFEFNDIYRLAKQAMVHIVIQAWTLYVPDRSLRMNQYNSKLKDIIANMPSLNVSVLKLPTLEIRSSHDVNALKDVHKSLPFPIQMSKAIWTNKKDGFPWHFSISDVQGCTHISGSIFKFIESKRTAVTVMVSMRAIEKRHEPSFAIHSDTSPFVLSLCESQLMVLHRSMESIRLLFAVSWTFPDNIRDLNFYHADRPQSPYFNKKLDLKDFMCTTDVVTEPTTTSEGTEGTIKNLELEPAVPPKNTNNYSVWLQWTLAKVSVRLFVTSEAPAAIQRKFILEMEDCITSYDQQDVYTKTKFKMGTMSGVCYDRSDAQEWMKHGLLGVVTKNSMHDNSQEETFFELTVTKALTKNVHGKWFTWKKKKKNPHLITTITEVMANIASVDLKLGPETLGSFVSLLKAFVPNSEQEIALQNPRCRKFTSVADLPLVFVKSQGIRVFVPLPSVASPDCNVLCLKITKIAIAPTAENPLVRKPLRSDIYSKAAELRILHVPGARVEDRQYEIVCGNISMSSGKWEQIREQLEPSEKTVKNARGKNPAFDWNNLTMKPSAVVKPIFDRFNMSIVYAPCILLDTILVCGQSIEINCLTDLMLTMQTLDVRLLLHIAKAVSKIANNYDALDQISDVTGQSSKIKLPKSSGVKESKPTDSTLSPIIERPFTDSGIDMRPSKSGWTTNSTISEHKTASFAESQTPEPNSMPYDMSFVGGIFNLKLYHQVQPIPADDSDQMQRVALLSLTLFQPNVLISQTHIEKTSQFSIFNTNLKLGTTSPKKDSLNEFGDIIFCTNPGKANQFGIHPPLICIKERYLASDDKEIELTAKRPIIVQFNHQAIDKLLMICQTTECYSIDVSTNSPNVPIEKSANKVKTLQKSVLGAKRVSVSIGSIDVLNECAVTKYSLRTSIDSARFNLAFGDRPQCLRFDGSVQSIMLRAGLGVVLHPLSIRLAGKLTNYSWTRIPVLEVDVRSGFLDICVGPDNLRILDLARTMFAASGEKLIKGLTRGTPNGAVIGSRGEELMRETILLSIETPSLYSNANVDPQQQPNDVGEYYQDDLRAGAFQFVESDLAEPLPLPYQIKIVSLDGGIICWHYPQPRSLHYVQIFPVLFNFSASSSHKPKSIKCELQYYLSICREFHTLCEFKLSDTAIQELSLPVNKVTANIWRILIHQSYVSIDGQHFDGDSDESDDNESFPADQQSGEKIIAPMPSREEVLMSDLHPRALVGCIRIDSLFLASNVPKVVVAVDIRHLSISLRHDRNPEVSTNCRMPNVISQYMLNQQNSTRVWDSFMKLYQRNFRAHASLLAADQTMIYVDSIVSASVLDFGYLNMLPLLEECHIKVGIDLNPSKATINIVTDVIRLRYGHAVGQTLTICQQLWTELESKQLILATRYILCNCTSSPIKLGQVNTEETLFLRSNEATFYAFRSLQADQHLRLSLETINWTGKESVLVSFKEDMQVITFLEPDQLAIAHTQKLSTSHVVVTLKGQIEVRNMSKMPFRVQYRVNTSKNEQENNIEAVEFSVEGSSTMSLVARCDEALNQSIKLRLSNETRRSWSGEIPLHRTHRNVPWLVKVPVEGAIEFSSYWVRVIREDITGFTHSLPNQPQRLLIVIWPLFIMRSMLPVDVVAYDRLTDSLYTLKACASKSVELSVPATHETEHEIEFDSNSYFSTKTKLSYNTIDRNLFYTDLDLNLSINKIIAELNKPAMINWPCAMREEELRWCRNVSQLDPMRLGFVRSPSRSLSSCLLLDVVSTCIFINSTPSTILLKNQNETSTVIHSNNLAMPTCLSDTFTISFMLAGKWYTSCPIHTPAARIRTITPNYELGDGHQGAALINILSPCGLTKFHLSSVIENGQRVLFLSPHFVFINSSSIKLNVFAFCVLQRQKAQIQIPDDSPDFVGTYEAASQKKSSNPRGVGLCTFFNLSYKPDDTNFNKLFNYFISLRIGRNEFSVPIQLNRSIQRKCFSLEGGKNGYHPVTLSVLEHEGQTFVSIYDDRVPSIRLENRTDQRMFVAQAESADATKAPYVVQKTLNDEHFEWFTSISPKATICYTPPSVDAGFPEKMDQSVAILLAADTFSPNGVQWSPPILISTPSETQLEQPYVKVAVNTSQRSVLIIISSIDRETEFNVKDIRTKLLRSPSFVAEPDTLVTQSKPSIAIKPTPEPTQRSAPPNATLSVNAFTKGFKLTLYADDDLRHCVKTEILDLYLDHLTVAYDQQTRVTRIDIANIQIDNQLHSAGKFDFSVLLCAQQPIQSAPLAKYKDPLPHPYAIDSYLKQVKGNPSLCAIRISFYENSFDVEEIHCSMQPLSAYIEDKYINVLLDFVLDNLPGNLLSTTDESETVREVVASGEVLVPRQVSLQALDLSQVLQLRRIRIEPVSVLLSVHTCMRMYIALDHSPLDFDAFERTNIYSLPARFGYHIGMHYVSGALFGAGWVVGSLEILGSPSGLARSVTTGLRDFVSMPVEGFWRGPWGLIMGITQGSASLVKNVTAGTVNSVTKMAASFARNLDRLTLDDEHMERTEALRRQRPRNISDGISQGLTGLGISILGAVGGLARHPREARSSMDVVTGFGRGLVGAVTKPISGAAELLALTGQGMLQTVGFNAMPLARQMTVPRVGSLEPTPAKILRKLLPAAYAEDQVLFAGIANVPAAGGGTCIALTQNLLLMVDLKSDRVRQIYSLERISLRTNRPDDSMLTLSTDNSSNGTRNDRGFQYDRIVAFVRESSEMLPRQSLVSMLNLRGSIGETIENEELLDNTSCNVSVVPNSASDALEPKAVVENNLQVVVESPAVEKRDDFPDVSLFMDPYLARYLVDYIDLLQQRMAATE